jgi:hypothetical protein
MPLVLKNCGIYFDGYDFSSDHNQINLSGSRDVLESTTFGSNSKTKALGLKDTKLTGSGFTRLDSLGGTEQTFYNEVETDFVQTLTTILPQTRTAGDVAYFFQSWKSKYTSLGKVGEIYPFSIDADGHGDMANGTILINGAVTTTGGGTAYNLGSVSATQFIYAGIHIYGLSGTNTPTITVKIQSDDNSGFTSPIDIITFTAATAIGSQWAIPVTGPSSDTYWRVYYTISGTNPSFNLLAEMAIM